VDYSCFLFLFFFLFEKHLFDLSLRIKFIHQTSHDFGVIFGSLAFCTHVVHDTSIFHLQVLQAFLLMIAENSLFQVDFL